MFHKRFGDGVRAEYIGSRAKSVAMRWTTVAVAMFIAVSPQSVLAAISFSGDIILNTGVPNSPAIIGNTSIGSLQLDNGSALSTGQSQIGSTKAGVGFATVIGPRTTWTAQSMDVGFDGIG
jgi:hypothetical protein